MKCPSCGAAVEAGADLCLECGEPMGETPAARVARNEAAPAKPAAPATSPAAAPARSPTPAPATKPAPPATKSVAPEKIPTAPATVVGKKKWRVEEPEPRRCPGCGTKTTAARCPGCGTKLIHDE